MAIEVLEVIDETDYLSIDIPTERMQRPAIEKIIWRSAITGNRDLIFHLQASNEETGEEYIISDPYTHEELGFLVQGNRTRRRSAFKELTQAVFERLEPLVGITIIEDKHAKNPLANFAKSIRFSPPGDPQT